MSKPYFVCHASQGVIRFSDGTKMATPPRSPAEKITLFAKIATIKQPECRECGETMAPVIGKSGKSKGVLKFVCEDCNAVQVMARQWKHLTEEQLVEKHKDADRTLRRAVRALNKIRKNR